jgi:uncharacterized protein
MKLYLDSSAFVKRFVDEPGSDTVEQLCTDADELCLGILCVPEILSALNRSLREGHLSRRDYLTIKQRIALETADATIVQLTPEVIRLSINALETSAVRAMDALHIGCALACGAALFATADRRQRTAAMEAGLFTANV